MDNSIYVLVRNRDGIIYQSEAHSLSSINDKGKFDILPSHANFITLVRNKITVRKKDGTVQDIPIDIGLLKASRNKVQVYLGVGNTHSPKQS